MKQRNIADLGGRHSGPCVILANGSSLTDHKLSDITCPTYGLNMSWQLVPNPTYHSALDFSHYKLDPEVYQRLSDEGRLIVAGRMWLDRHLGYPVAFNNADKFAFDIPGKGAVIGWQGVGSVAYFALQIAVFMGFDPVIFLGLDLHGDHFHGRWPTATTLPKQAMLFRMAAKELEGRVTVLNAGSPNSGCDAFPLVPASVVPGLGATENLTCQEAAP